MSDGSRRLPSLERNNKICRYVLFVYALTDIAAHPYCTHTPQCPVPTYNTDGDAWLIIILSVILLLGPSRCRAFATFRGVNCSGYYESRDDIGGPDMYSYSTRWHFRALCLYTFARKIQRFPSLYAVSYSQEYHVRRVLYTIMWCTTPSCINAMIRYTHGPQGLPELFIFIAPGHTDTARSTARDARISISILYDRATAKTKYHRRGETTDMYIIHEYALFNIIIIVIIILVYCSNLRDDPNRFSSYGVVNYTTVSLHILSDFRPFYALLTKLSSLINSINRTSIDKRQQGLSDMVYTTG